MRKNCFLSLLLCATLVFTLMPSTSVLAASNPVDSISAVSGESVQEQFTLTPGGTYYFDLSAQGVPGTVNSDLPDTTLKWVPFTYAGTINAYSLDASSNGDSSASGNAAASDRSLFVAEYNISYPVSWKEFNTDSDGDFIFGDDYSSGGVSYLMRALSVGSYWNGEFQRDARRGTPETNEWDQILNKNEAFIKNWSGILSWGQDTFSADSLLRAVRGNTYARNWSKNAKFDNFSGIGWRPALEIKNPAALGPDGLKTVIFDMDGKGTLGGGLLESATVVYTGELTLPAITPANGFNYPGTGTGPLGWHDGSNFYEVGTVLDSLPNGTTLTAGYYIQEQFTLAPGGTYYFDLSAVGVPGTVNTALPDTTLKWVPFTYAGTVNAYSLDVSSSDDSTASDNAKVSDRSLFVADYNIVHTVSWDELNTDADGDFIFGDDYSSGGVIYLMRTLSAGSRSRKTGDIRQGAPETNEWDQILNKDGAFIKNWSGILSWGQDTNLYHSSNRPRRGYVSPRTYYDIEYNSRSFGHGWRPVLEVLNPVALGSDGLKTITFDMDNNGTLGGGSLKSATMVYTGDLILPEISQANGFNCTDSAARPLGWYDGSIFYEAGTVLDSLPNGTTLKAVAKDAVDPVTCIFDKKTISQADVQAAIKWGSAKSVSDVKTGSTSIGADNYNVSADTLTIKREYLAAQSTGSLVLTVEFNTGTAATLTITITDSTPPSISPAHLNYDLSNPQDVSTTITWNSAASVTDVVYSVSPDVTLYTLNTVDFTVTDNDLTIANSFFTDIAVTTGDSLVFTINFDTGATATLTVNVANSYVPSNNADLSRLSVNGMPVSDFNSSDPDGAEYDVELPYGSTTATVVAIASDISADVDITQTSSLPGSAIVVVTAEDATTTKTYTINFTITASPGGGNNGGGGGRDTPAAPEMKAKMKVGNNTETALSLTVNNGDGTASVNAGSLKLDQDGAIITIPSIPEVGIFTVCIPVAELSSSDAQGSLTINTDNYNISVPSNMLTDVSGISGSNAEISIGHGDKSNLPDDVKAAIGDRPLVQLSLSIDGEQIDWNNSDAPVTVHIPYTPTTAEFANPESIVVWYIDSNGNVVSVPNGRYDPVTGTVRFFTTHFSGYAVAYVHQTFNDLDSVGWAKKAIEVMASKGIARGTGNDTFSPRVNITRADYMVLLIEALGLSADFTENFDDVRSDAYYYNAVGIARELCITSGSGNNRFNPTENITRQDMMVLATRVLEKYQGLKAADESTVLERFVDRKDITEYAVNSLATLVDAGLIKGSGNKLSPRSYTTRAEAVVFIYHIYNKYPAAPVQLSNVSDTRA